MAHNREVPENRLVALEAGKLFGFRQVANVLSRTADDGSQDDGGPVGCVNVSRTGMSRLLSKNGVEGGRPMDLAFSRIGMSRLLSKNGIES
jgi:hypothetical protein